MRRRQQARTRSSSSTPGSAFSRSPTTRSSWRHGRRASSPRSPSRRPRPPSRDRPLADGEGGRVSAAVVLMAYGSPDRIDDVPAYYADIRGGRTVRPELLADLTERYRRLGIENSNPLNEITERT